MKRKDSEKERAQQLRKKGYSLKKIANKLQVSKSSVSLWCRELPEHEILKKEYKQKRLKQRKETESKKEQLKKIKIKVKVKIKDETIYNGRVYVRCPDGYEGKRYKHNFILKSRFLMEQKLNRTLAPNETVHHRDGNKQNDNPDNLEVLNLKEHSRLHGIKQKRYVLLQCPSCKKIFERERRKTHLVKDTKLTFCSRICIGKFFNQERRSNPKLIEKAIQQNIIKEYIK